MAVSTSTTSTAGIRVRGIDRVIGNLRKLKTKTQKVLGQEARKAGLAIKRGASSRCPRDSNELKQSLTCKVRRKASKGYAIADVFSEEFYARFVELGTGSFYTRKQGMYKTIPPHTAGGGRVSSDYGSGEDKGVASWAKRHGMDPYILALAIGGRLRNRPSGTKPQPFLGPAFAVERPMFPLKLYGALGFLRRGRMK